MVLASIGKAGFRVKDGSFGFFVVNLVILRFNKQKIDGFKASLKFPTGAYFDDFFKTKEKRDGGSCNQDFHLPYINVLVIGMFP